MVELIGDITVVIPHLPEREAFVERALNSVDAQTLQPSCTIVETVMPGENAATVRNRALARVQTAWIAWLDDDDEFLPNHLATCRQAAAYTGADLVYPGMEIVGREDPLAVSVNGQWVNPFGVPFGVEQQRHLRIHGNFIPITYLVRTKFVKMVNGFPQPTETVPEDHGLLIKLLDIGAIFHHVPERTWRYHIHDGNTGGVPR